MELSEAVSVWESGETSSPAISKVFDFRRAAEGGEYRRLFSSSIAELTWWLRD